MSCLHCEQHQVRAVTLRCCGGGLHYGPTLASQASLKAVKQSAQSSVSPASMSRYVNACWLVPQTMMYVPVGRGLLLGAPTARGTENVNSAAVLLGRGAPSCTPATGMDELETLDCGAPTGSPGAATCCCRRIAKGHRHKGELLAMGGACGPMMVKSGW